MTKQRTSELGMTKARPCSWLASIDGTVACTHRFPSSVGYLIPLKLLQARSEQLLFVEPHVLQTTDPRRWRRTMMLCLAAGGERADPGYEVIALQEHFELTLIS